ncbi:hypothetical protein IIC38_07495 [candidate division KSB1 bacterium]|nr:hypothetical protein [candidate division KSB1 bacterium]
MLYQTLYYVHAVIGYAIALYALLLYWLDYRIGRIESSSTEYQQFNQTMQKIHRGISFSAIVAFLIGGYMGTPFFKVGALWIILKLILFIVWMGIMGVLGTKALKLRMETDKTNESLVLAQKKMNLYKHMQLIIIATMFYLVYTKPL